MTNDKNTPGHGSGATTAQAIASAVGLGVLLLVAAFIGYALRCWGNSSGECAAIRASPPWTLMTTMAAAPCVLLTWYWRTEHKKRDILDASRAQIAQRFATAVEMLDKGGHTTIGAIYALEQIAQDSPADHWTIVETLAAFVRNACLKPASSGDERRAQVQAAISVLGRRRAEHDPEGATIDLREASLWGIKFDGLNFARANFEFAKVNDSTFFGTDLSGARVDNIIGVWTDEDAYLEGQVAHDSASRPGRFNDQTRGAEERRILASRWLQNADEMKPTPLEVAASVAEKDNARDGT